MKLFTLVVGSNPPTINPLYNISGSGNITLATGTFTQVVATRRSLGIQAIVYSASMTIALGSGAAALIVATNNTAFTINAPTGTPLSGDELEVTIKNTSGGALGAVTWNAIFKMSAWTQPATGFSRAILFRYDGTNWVQKSQTGVDIPN